LTWFNILKNAKIAQRQSLDDDSNNEDTQKAAGAVTSATPGIHNIRYSRRKKRGKKERED